MTDTTGLVVLTSASGKQCSKIIPLLQTTAPTICLRLIVNSPTSASTLQTRYPKAEVICADLNNVSDCHNILSGATAIVHIGPSFHPRETQIGLNVVDAAIAEWEKPDSGFRHFIYSSVLNPQLSKLLNHDRKRYVEEVLAESTLPWTILQPTHFADPAVAALVGQRDQEKLVYPALFDPGIQFSFLALKDLAEVTLKVIMEREKHFYASYPLVSFGPISYRDFVKNIGEQLGKEVEIKELPYPVAVEKICDRTLGAKGSDQKYRDGAERLILFYNKRGLIGSPNVLQWLLGREPTGPGQMAVIEDGEKLRIE